MKAMGSPGNKTGSLRAFITDGERGEGERGSLEPHLLPLLPTYVSHHRNSWDLLGFSVAPLLFSYPGSLLEMQNLRVHPRPAESESASHLHAPGSVISIGLEEWERFHTEKETKFYTTDSQI